MDLPRRDAARRPLTARGRLPLLAVAGALAVTAATAGCGGGSSPDPQTTLEQAQKSLDGVQSLHFSLASDNVPHSGTVLVGGDGDVERPDKFKGTLKVTRSGLGLSVDVVSVGGTVYIKVPLTPAYVKADPSTYGFSDPGALLDPDTGLSHLLHEAQDPKSAGRDRYQGEVLDEIDVTFPGQAVKDALTSADPSQPVQGTLGVSHDSHELRRAVLTGPFLDQGLQSTFTVVLTDYGEDVSISAP